MVSKESALNSVEERKKHPSFQTKFREINLQY